MNPITRRNLILGGGAAAAGVGGLDAADRLAKRYGLIPPDGSGVYGPGETLTYACQRLLTRNTPAREFPRSMISKNPFANAVAPPNDAFRKLQAGGFRDWRLVVDGTVAPPDVVFAGRSKGSRAAQPDHRGCLRRGMVVHRGMDRDAALRRVARSGRAAADAVCRLQLDRGRHVGEHRHAGCGDPHTLLTMGMNDGDLPVGFGGPLRLRLPRQLGYKSVKYVNRITATDNIKKFGKGLGSVSPEYGYAWYAGM